MNAIRRIAHWLLLLACAVPAGAGEADWQTSAKGLTEGPLCSLVLRARIGKAVTLFAPGASCDTGWGTIGPTNVPLGSIGLPTPSAVVSVERTGDWSHSKAVVALEGGAQLTIYASMLSPGIVVETSADKLRLFGGQYEHMASFDGGKMKIHGFMNGNLAAKTAITPAHIAVPQEGGAKVFATSGAIPVPPIDQAWALVWWGKSSHFIRTDCPVAGTGVHAEAYLADCPLLLVFDKPPLSLAAVKEGGLAVIFPEGGHRVAILPLAGAAHLDAATTQGWADALPADVAARCKDLASIARQYPLSVRETFQYDPAKDEATFIEKATFLPVGTGGTKLTPIPPMAVLARDLGMASSKGGSELRTLPAATDFGVLLGAADTDTIAWSFKGLGAHVVPPGPPHGGGKVPAALEAELAAQVKRLPEGGRLAPWIYADNIPISASRGECYWGEPGEVLGLLAQILPLLSEPQQTALIEHLRALRKTYPPESVAWIPADQGARRGGYDPGPCDVSKTLAKERGQRVSLFALYGLERFYALAGEKPTAKAWEACKKVVADAFQEQGWATLYPLGHPDREIPWEGGPDRAKVRKVMGPTESWRGDRPAAVVNASRQFAGAIGAIRLARLVNDKETEQKGWWLFARSAALRYAMGKYAAWRYQAGLAKVPPKPDWFWTWRGRGPQNWGGDLEIDRWTKPSDDVQQVVELAPDRVQLGHWAGVMGDKWTQMTTAQLLPFRYMTPELAAFLRDHLKAECEAYVRRVEWNQPTWYASFAEANLGWEHNMNPPSDAYQVFMARSMILGEKADQLAKWIDVPWLERGDLFYLNKLAETIRAYRSGR